MKHYKLLKGLPTFKAGGKFHINKNGNLVHDDSGVVAYALCTLQKFPNILEDWFEEIPEEHELANPWEPVVGEFYWYVDVYGGVDFDVFRDYSLPGRTRLELGNCFRTEKEAEKAMEWLKARKILLDDTKGFRVEKDMTPYAWDRNFKRYWFVYADGRGVLGTLFSNGDIDASALISFPNKEAAQASIDKHEREWKIYLGVDE